MKISSHTIDGVYAMRSLPRRSRNHAGGGGHVALARLRFL